MWNKGWAWLDARLVRLLLTPVRIETNGLQSVYPNIVPELIQ